MKAVVQQAIGEPANVLQVIELTETAEPAPGHILIDVSLAPVHHGDLQLIRSQRTIPSDTGYVRRGSEAVGIVRSLGSDVMSPFELSVGDRVIAFPTAGSWADRIVVPAATAFRVPDDIDDEVAGQLLINFVTARMILRGLHKSVPQEELRAGAVLVTGASTVVARLLMHLLKKDGLTPIGLARNSVSLGRIAAELQGTFLEATDRSGWQARVTSIAGRKKIVGVLDCVYGPLLADIEPLLADDAAIVSYGALGGTQFGIGPGEMIARQFVLRGVVFTRWFSELTPAEQADDVRAAFELARALPTLFKTSAIFALDDVQDAVAAVEAPGREGFIFLRP